jgi:hypothetical protein
MRWSPPCKDLSLEAEERPALVAVAKQRDWDTSLCMTVICEVLSRALKLSNKKSYQSKARLSSFEHVTILNNYVKQSLASHNFIRN